MKPFITWLVTALAVFTTASYGEPLALAVNSDDVVDADRLLRIDLANGFESEVLRLPSSFEDVEGLALASDTVAFGVDSATKQLIRIDLDQNTVDAVGLLGFPLSSVLDFGLTYTCDGRLLLVAEETQSLYTVDQTTGAARVVQGSGMLGAPMTAIASYGANTLALDNIGGLYSVDTQEATATLLFTLPGFPATNGDAGLSFDADGILWAVASDNGNDSRIYAIDINSSTATQVATTRVGIESLAMANAAGCTPVGGGPLFPEHVPVNGPWALALLVLLLAGFGLRSVRRSHF